jgi:hypothetical protein
MGRLREEPASQCWCHRCDESPPEDMGVITKRFAFEHHAIAHEKDGHGRDGDSEPEKPCLQRGQCGRGFGELRMGGEAECGGCKAEYPRLNAVRGVRCVAFNGGRKGYESSHMDLR